MQPLALPKRKSPLLRAVSRQSLCSYTQAYMETILIAEMPIQKHNMKLGHLLHFSHFW